MGMPPRFQQLNRRPRTMEELGLLTPSPSCPSCWNDAAWLYPGAQCILPISMGEDFRFLMTSRVYLTCLSIQEISEDSISPGDHLNPPTLTDLGVKVANWELVTGEDVKNVMKNGGVLKRSNRYSLTFRDVERVSSAKSFMRR